MNQREYLTEDDIEAMGLRAKRTLQKDRVLGRGLPYVKLHGIDPLSASRHRSVFVRAYPATR